MEYRDRFNSEMYTDMTAYLAMKNIENDEKTGRNRMIDYDNWYYRRGDIYVADLDPYVGSEQGGRRPVVVIQNDAGNYFSSTLIVAPMTSKTAKKASFPTHFLVPENEFLKSPSVILCEQIRTIDKRRIKRFVGRISKKDMSDLDSYICCSLGLAEPIPEEIEAP